MFIVVIDHVLNVAKGSWVESCLVNDSHFPWLSFNVWLQLLCWVSSAPFIISSVPVELIVELDRRAVPSDHVIGSQGKVTDGLLSHPVLF